MHIMSNEVDADTPVFINDTNINGTVEAKNDSLANVLHTLQRVLDSPFIMSIASFALVALLLILIGFCIVRQIWGTRWGKILQEQKACIPNYQHPPPKFLHQLDNINENCSTA